MKTPSRLENEDTEACIQDAKNLVVSAEGAAYRPENKQGELKWLII